MTTITALPDAPNPLTDSQASYNAKALALTQALPTFVTETNTVAGEVNAAKTAAESAATTATTKAGEASSSAGTATTKAGEAAASAATALAAPGTSATSTTSLTVGTGTKSLTIQAGKSIAIGQSVTLAYTTTPTTRMSGAVTAYDSGTGALTVFIDTIKGSGTYAAWTISLGSVPASGIPDLAVSLRTADAQLTSADKGTFIDVTSGSFTQTADTPANLGAGWWCYYRNSGSGKITQTGMDGLSSFVMYPHETRLITCDGSALTSKVITPYFLKETASFTYVKPPGYAAHDGYLWSGGASAANAGTATYASGGGGGACVPFHFLDGALGATETITIAASATGPSVESNGVAGNNSSIGTLLTAYGGQAGSKSNTVVAGGFGAGVFASAKPYNTIATSNGVDADFGGGRTSTGTGVPPGSSVYGGASGGNGENTSVMVNGGRSLHGGGGGGGFGGTSYVGTGGDSTFAGGGGDAGNAVSGGDGIAPAGGGGATKTGTKAGDGARGELQMWGVL